MLFYFTPVKGSLQKYMVRFKNRYLLIELLPFLESEAENDTESLTKFNFTPASISAYIRRSVEINYGLAGVSSILQSLSVKYANRTTMMAIVRVPRDFFQEIWTCVTLLTDFPTDTSSTDNSCGNMNATLKCIWRVVHCAGTIRSCQKAAIAYSRTILRLTDQNQEEAAESIAKRIKLIDP